MKDRISRGSFYATNTSDGALSESYAYDAMGRLQTVTVTELNGQPVDDVTTYTYDADGNLHTTVTNTGSATLTATDTYDDLDRLKTLANTDASGNVISSYTYTRNAMGDITEVDEAGTQVASRTVKYQYDALERLTSETDIVGTTSTTTSYTYDLVGNRSTQTDASGTTTFHYTADDQLQTESSSSTVTSYSYDANGSLTQTKVNGTTTAIYTYDARGRLTSATVNNQQESFNYDAGGNQVSSATTASGTTIYEIDEQSPTGYSQVLAEEGATGSIQAAYAWGLQLIAQSRPVTGTSLYMYDGHGSVRALSNGLGTVTDTYAYDAFGNLISVPASTSNVYLYSGQRWDAILGEYDLRARNYDSSTGQFTSMDDPRFTGGPGDLSNANLYLYSQSNPANRIDLSGHDDFSLSGLLVTAGIQTALFASRVAGGAVLGALAGGGIGGILHLIQTRSFTGLGEAIESGALQGAIQGAIIGGAGAIGGIALPLALGGLLGYNIGQAIPALLDSDVRPETKVAIIILLFFQARATGLALSETGGPPPMSTRPVDLVKVAKALERMQATGKTRANYFNPGTGDFTENLVNLQYTNAGYIYLGRQVPFETPHGTRIADLQFCDPETGEIFNVESKTNNSPYGGDQEAADRWIEENMGIKTVVERVNMPLPWE